VLHARGHGDTKQAAKASARGDNPAQVTNEALEKQQRRAQRDRLQRVVFVKNGDRVRLQRVETGIADSAHIEIKRGLQPGDEVVSGSYSAVSSKLKDGAKVKIEKPEKSG
jgi:HlyD family secretion protein